MRERNRGGEGERGEESSHHPLCAHVCTQERRKREDDVRECGVSKVMRERERLSLSPIFFFSFLFIYLYIYYLFSFLMILISRNSKKI